jgi:hypothetical protein
VPEPTPPDAPTTPPQIEDAIVRLRDAITSVQGIALDPLTASWPDIESGVVKLLMGAYAPDNPSHQAIAFMVGATFAERLRRELGAFWFPSRATRHGAALGFADGVIVFSPFEAVEQALSRARLASLDDMVGELRGLLAQARAQPAAANPEGGGQPLGPEDYRRLFDPGFVQFVGLDPAALAAVLGARPEQIKSDLEQAFARLPPEVPKQVKQPTRRRIVEALGQLNPLKTLGQQATRAPQLAELLALLFAGKAETGFAPAELWADLLLPLSHIGPAEAFPDLDPEAVAAYEGGAEPLLLYVDTLPYQQPAADEDGLLGAFADEQVAMLDPSFDGAAELRVLRLAPEALRPIWSGLDASALRTAIEQFRAHCQAAASATPPEAPGGEGEPSLLDVSLALLENAATFMKTVEAKNLIPCVRHATESEASSEPILRALRQAHTAPRIVLV